MSPKPGTAPLPLIGRQLELGLINEMLAAAADGRGGTLFLHGEGGVGKSRVVQAAAERAGKKQWTVLFGTAYPVERGVPYAVFADAFVPILRAMDPAQLSILTRGGAELRQIFPALGAGSADDRASAGAEPAEVKARLLWNFSQFLNRLAAKQPVLLVLENLHWADASSVEMLHFLARQLGQEHRIAIIGTYNEAERDANEALRLAEQSLGRMGSFTSHRVEPLTAPQVAELLRETFAVSEEVAGFDERLYDWTRGNPYFIEETLKWLIDRGHLAEREGRWTGWEIRSLELPPTVREVLSARLDLLGPAARTVANLAAVIGTRASYTVLRSVTGLADSDLVAALDELSRKSVLQENSREHEVSYDFAHPMLREVLYAALGRARVSLLHGEVAESLERLYGASAPAHAGELAFHYSRAQAHGLVPKAVTYLTAAGQTALDAYANREAADYLAAALEHLDRHSPESPETRQIVMTLARARQRMGEYEPALALWSRALASAESSHDRAAIAAIQHRMGLALYWSARYDEALARYAEGLAVASQIADGATTVRLRLARSMCLQDLGRFPDATREVTSALAEAEKLGNPALTARVHRALSLLHAWTGETKTARKHGERALQLSVEAKQHVLAWSAHWAMGMVAGLDSDADSLVRHVGEASRLADELRSPLLPLWTAELSIQYASGIGNWETGIATGERVIAQARALGQKTLLPRLLVWTGTIHLWRGEHARAFAMFDEAWKVSGAGEVSDRPVDVTSVVPAHLGMTAYNLATRAFAEAIAVGEAGLALADRTGHVIWALHWLLPLVTEASLYSADFERAERHGNRLRTESKRLGHRLGAACAVACDGLLILLRDRDPARAAPVLRESVEQLEGIPYPVFGARMRRQLARALSEAGQRDEAMRELRRAHDVFARLGAAAELDATRDHLRLLGARPPARTLAAGAAGLTGREIEIARMVAARKANKEIGAALKISARTVSTHLSNIFSKLNVESRGELADYVRERGLLEG